MRKFLIVSISLALLCGFSVEGQAQMKDEDVIAYIKSGMAAGKGEKQIGAELLARGVTRAQAERIKAGLETGTGTGIGTGTAESSETTKPTHVMRERKTDESELGVADDTDMFAAETADAANSSEPRIYGHNVFNGKALTFEPNENMATPENYKLGPGDQVIIELWGFNEATYNQTISPEGRITISQVGPIYLSGLTIKEAQAKIRNVLRSKYASIDGAQTEVSLTLGNIRSIQVNMMGEVAVPGTYRLSSFSTVFHALHRAGGVTKTGSLRGIKVIRGGREIATVDVYGYLFTGKSESDIRLEEGDVVLVPPYIKIATVEGGVRRPMSYELAANETLADLVRYAGDFTGNAYKDDISIVRNTGREQEIFTISSDRMKSCVMEDGDVVTIGSSLDRFANRIEIRGYVFRPGMFQLGSDIKTVKQLVERAGGLTEDAFLDRAIIMREMADLTLETVSFDLGAVLKGTNADIALRKNDVVIISGIHELESRGPLSINGLVANPGEYPFAENTTIEDLILQAGGLLNGASAARVEVARRDIDPMSLTPSDTLGRTFTFSLENGLAVGSGHGFILQPYDVVSIRRSPGFVSPQHVVVEGEVAFPGSYVLLTKDERISDVIKRAGAVTAHAYLKGGVVVRKTSDEELTLNSTTRKMVNQGGGRDSVDVSKLSFANQYTLGIDLAKAVAEPGCDDDIILRDGDRIIVPEYLSTVRIQGDVMYPNTVLYHPDKGMSYYIDAAGGYGSKAKRSKVYIIYMNGNVTKGSKLNAKIEPGCEIVVPTRKDRRQLTVPEIMSMSTSAASLTTMIATVVSLLTRK